MSSNSSLSVERRIRQGRSAVTNGTRALIGGKMSTKYGRRYRDLIAQYTEELGGVVRATDTVMIRQAAALALRCEMMQADIIAGVAVDADDAVRLSSEIRRLLGGLRAQRDLASRCRSQPHVPSDLASYLAGLPVYAPATASALQSAPEGSGAIEANNGITESTPLAADVSPWGAS